jgi:hypothetical protein
MPSTAHIIQLNGLGVGQAAVTCQILPADFPGFQPYCPYTAPAIRWCLARPEPGHGQAACQGVRHHQCAGDRLERRRERQLLSRAAAEAAWLPCNVAQHLRQQVRQGKPQSAQHGPAGPGWLRSRHPDGVHLLRAVPQLPVPASSKPERSPQPRLVLQPARGPAGQPGTGLAGDRPGSCSKVWAQLYRLVSDQAPVVPLFTLSPAVFVSARAGNYQGQPMYGPLLDQIRVK